MDVPAALSGALACPPAQLGPRAAVPSQSPLSYPLEQICVPVESSSPLVTSNRKEVLRCFTVLGEQRPGLGTLAWGCGHSGSFSVGPPLPGPACDSMGLSPEGAHCWLGLEVEAARSRDSSLQSKGSPTACCSPERLLAFLLPKLDSSHERTRVGSLQVLKHIINSAGECAEQCLRILL